MSLPFQALPVRATLSDQCSENLIGKSLSGVFSACWVFLPQSMLLSEWSFKNVNLYHFIPTRIAFNFLNGK